MLYSPQLKAVYLIKFMYVCIQNPHSIFRCILPDLDQKLNNYKNLKDRYKTAAQRNCKPNLSVLNSLNTDLKLRLNPQQVYATIMVLKNCPIIGEHAVIIFVT